MARVFFLDTLVRFVCFFVIFCNFHTKDLKEKIMVEVTKLGGQKILVNPDLMEFVEETPDTVISLTTGRKIIVKESRQEVKNLVKLYRKDILAD